MTVPRPSPPNAPATTLAGALALAVLALACAAPGARAQGPSLLIYGNYCGPGSNAPRPPIDALDAACARHDACTPDWAAGQATSCACNRRLQFEAGAVARDPYAPPQTRQTAQFISDFAAALPCR